MSADSIEDGGTAFPGETVERFGMHATKRVVHGGMTLRDWFAGQALAGIIAHADKFGALAPTIAAEAAYEAADAMLAARKGGDQ